MSSKPHHTKSTPVKPMTEIKENEPPQERRRSSGRLKRKLSRHGTWKPREKSKAQKQRESLLKVQNKTNASSFSATNAKAAAGTGVDDDQSDRVLNQSLATKLRFFLITSWVGVLLDILDALVSIVVSKYSLFVRIFIRDPQITSSQFSKLIFCFSSSLIFLFFFYTHTHTHRPV